jgi:hypothetical protein
MTFSKNVTGHSDGISIVKDYLVFVANLIFILNNACKIYIREGPLKGKKSDADMSFFFHLSLVCFV